MDRTELENRIRTSLEARAKDVAPTPHLWEKVTDRRARHTRWMVGLWALAGSAAVAVVAIAAVQVVRAPDGPPVIDNPPVTEEPTPTEEPTDLDPAPGGTTGPVSVVTTDGDALYEVEPSTGEVANELPVFDGLAEGGPIGSVAVRPGDGPELTVATMIGIEGSNWELDVTTFGPDRSHQGRHRATPLDDQGNPDGRGAGGAYSTDIDANTETSPPTVVWSPDGQYLAWVRVNSDGSGDMMGISHEDLVAGEEPTVVATGLTADVGHLRAQSWTAEGTLYLTGSGGGDVILEVPTDCFEDVDCTGQEPGSLFMEGGSIIDVAHHGNGSTLALVARGATNQDAEGGSLELLVEPMSDVQHALELPDGVVPDGSASLPDGWLEAAGDHVVVGFGPRAALLAVTGEFAEDLEVVDSVDLPGGTRAAGLAETGTEAVPDAEPGGSPTDPELDVAAVGEDGVPEHVVVYEDGAEGPFALVHRSEPGEPIATWSRPDGVALEASLAQVVVHPASTPTDLQVVSRWVIGESDTFAWTTIRDGEVVANTAFDAEGQPQNSGGAAETADSAPVFSPTGDWLAWVETPEGAQGPAQIRIVSWSDDGPTGPTTEIEAPEGETRPMALLDWAAQPPDTDILTMRSASAPDGQSEPGYVEFTMDGFDGTEPDDDAVAWRRVGLPEPPVDAGSFLFEDGSERYVVFGHDPLWYGLAEAPDSAVEIGPDEPRFHFGPDSVVVPQEASDTGWARVQVDTGVASMVTVPDGTVALLPWTAAGAG